MIDTEHLDRVERFAHWLEQRRKQAGLTQKELADLCGISHSYYSKVVNIGHLREKYGDSSREVTCPRSIRTFDGALTAFGERLGAGCRDEGMEIWGSLDTTKEPIVSKATSELGTDKAALLSEVLEALVTMPPGRLKLVRDLIDQLK